jgi:predicted nucleotidyltransferase
MDRQPDPETLTALEPHLARLRQRFGPLRAILFGSRARGDHLRASDFDLILISEAFRGMSFRDRIIAAATDWEGEFRLDVLCYTPEEFERKASQIGVVAAAARQGLELQTS